MTTYSEDPTRLGDLVSYEEAVDVYRQSEVLFSGRKGARRAIHYAERVARTLEASRTTMQRLHAEVQRIQSSSSASSMGQVSSLDPRTAARYLTPEQLAEQFDSHLLARVRHIASVEEDAKKTRTDLIKMLSQVKFVISQMGDTLPPAQLKRLKELLAAAPTIPDIAEFTANIPQGMLEPALSAVEGNGVSPDSPPEFADSEPSPLPSDILDPESPSSELPDPPPSDLSSAAGDRDGDHGDPVGADDPGDGGQSDTAGGVFAAATDTGWHTMEDVPRTETVPESPAPDSAPPADPDNSDPLPDQDSPSGESLDPDPSPESPTAPSDGPTDDFDTLDALFA